MSNSKCSGLKSPVNQFCHSISIKNQFPKQIEKEKTFGAKKTTYTYREIRSSDLISLNVSMILER
jgi:hypothetical protein